MKIGLVVEGGASRVFFSCGVMDGLLRADLMADYVIGVSAGIADAVSYVSRQQGRNLAILQNYYHTKQYMGMRHILNPRNRSLYNLDYIFREIPEKLLPFDHEAFRAFPGDVIAVVTNLETGKAEYLPQLDDDPSNTLLQATCALPLLFPPIEVNGHRYMDGGISDPIPVDAALRAGCDRLVVLLTRDRAYRKTPEKAALFAARAYHRYPGFAAALRNRTDCYNASLDRVRELEEEGRAFVIAPRSIEVGRTETSPEVLQKIYDQGLSVLEESLPNLRAFWKGEA